MRDDWTHIRAPISSYADATTTASVLNQGSGICQRRRGMGTFKFRTGNYEVDEDGFLRYPAQWDEHFAEEMAPMLGIEKLTESHWSGISFIRDRTSTPGIRPSVYEVCKAHRLRLAELESLFPSGYLRGACKLAGLTYSDGPFQRSWLPRERRTSVSKPLSKRTYHVDIRGFLVDH